MQPLEITSGQLDAQKNSNTRNNKRTAIKIGPELFFQEQFDLKHQIKKEILYKLLKEKLIPNLQEKKKNVSCFIVYNEEPGQKYHDYWVGELDAILQIAGIKILYNKLGSMVRFDKIIKDNAILKLVIITKLSQEKNQAKPGEVSVVSAKAGMFPILLEETASGNFQSTGNAEKIPYDFVNNDYFKTLLKLIQTMYGLTEQDAFYVDLVQGFEAAASNVDKKVTPEQQQDHEKKLREGIISRQNAVLQEMRALIEPTPEITTAEEGVNINELTNEQQSELKKILEAQKIEEERKLRNPVNSRIIKPQNSLGVAMTHILISYKDNPSFSLFTTKLRAGKELVGINKDGEAQVYTNTHGVAHILFKNCSQDEFNAGITSHPIQYRVVEESEFIERTNSHLSLPMMSTWNSWHLNLSKVLLKDMYTSLKAVTETEVKKTVSEANKSETAAAPAQSSTASSIKPK